MRRVRLALLFVALAVSAGGAQPSGIAYLAVDVRGGRTLASENLAHIDRPAIPGSVVKVATLAAALESGVITARSGILCPRVTTVAGQTLRCSHPDLRRPLRAAEALAHSCNGFFAAVAARLSRAALDDALVRLGLPRSNPQQPVAAAALGVGGIEASPRQLVRMLIRIATEPEALRWRTTTVDTIREGLEGAARYGTASGLADSDIDALAKTGTVVVDGRSRGMVVGVTPARAPSTAFVLLASGASGAQAAELAASRLPGLRQGPMTLRIGVTGQAGGYAIREMPIEDYTAGVVAGEAAEKSRPAAFEALAITVRTFALANLGRHAADGFDLCDLTHCQVLRRATPATQRAATATAGRVLLHEGKAASIYYSASCGGFTQRPSAVWRGAADAPFLPSRVDNVHAESPWQSVIAAADLTRVMRAGGFRGDLVRDLRIDQLDTSGRVAWLRVDGMVPGRIAGNDLRALTGRVLGWQHLKSTAFEVRREGGGYRFTGRGAGHGVGLCVLGAALRSIRGDSADAILSAYFPGLRIGPIPAPAGDPAAGRGITVILPESDQRDRNAIEEHALRSRDRLVARLGVVPPARITLRFHPTVESYQRATGQPWFTAGASQGSEVHLLPATVLRRRGQLESTIAHELVHVLTATTLEGRPLWVIEGAARHFTGGEQKSAMADQESATRARPRLPGASECPADGEFRTAASAAALSDAYARAEQCFVARLRAGTRWTEMGR